MTLYKRGRRPPQHTLRAAATRGLMSAALDPLGPAPAVCSDRVSSVKVPWGLYRNDVLSNCVPCDTAHTLMLRTAVSGKITVPTQVDVDNLYMAVGGWSPGDETTDQGCSEADMEAYLRSRGFLGHVADATGSVDPQNLDHIRWCIELFGSCRLGLNLPGYAENQFDAGRPWTVSDSGDQSIDGHDVPLVHYDENFFYCVTWGKLQDVAVPFIQRYCEEAHSELYYDWIEASAAQPSAFDLGALAEKMEQVDS